MKVTFVLTNGYMYGDNKALYNLMPKLMSYGISPLMIIPINSDANRIFRKLSIPVIDYHDKDYSSIYFQKIVSTGSIVKDFLIKCKFATKSLFLSPKEFNDIIKSVANFGPDIIHTNNSGCVLGFKLAKRLGVKHVWHIREYGDLDANWSYFPSKSHILRRLNDKQNYNIAITNDIKMHFSLKSNVSVIYDGPLKDEQRPIIIGEKESYFLFVGRLFPKKGVELLLTSMKEVVSLAPKCRLFIAGDGDSSYTQYLKSFVKEKGLQESVQFLGYRTDIPILMQKAKAVIVPSESEAFGFITAEAMSNGALVIGRNTAGTKEQMDNVDIAMKKDFCIRFSNGEELTDAMIKIWSMNVKIEELVQVSCIVRQMYSADESSAKLFECLNKLL